MRAPPSGGIGQHFGHHAPPRGGIASRATRAAQVDVAATTGLHTGAMATPRHVVIARDLRNLITSGDLKPGERLPTEHELSARYGVGRSPVRAAFTALVNEGLVETRRPAGHFVRSHSQWHYDPSAAPHDFVPGARAAGQDASETVKVSLVAATPALAGRLGVSPGHTLVARTRLHSLGGEPLKTCDTYWRMDLVAHSPIMAPDGPEDGFGAVLSELGAAATRARHEYHVRMAGLDEIEQLALPGSTPVAVHVRTDLDRQGDPVQCQISVLPGDRVVVVTTNELVTGSDGIESRH